MNGKIPRKVIQSELSNERTYPLKAIANKSLSKQQLNGTGSMSEFSNHGAGLVPRLSQIDMQARRQLLRMASSTKMQSKQFSQTSLKSKIQQG